MKNKQNKTNKILKNWDLKISRLKLVFIAESVFHLNQSGFLLDPEI